MAENWRLPSGWCAIGVYLFLAAHSPASLNLSGSQAQIVSVFLVSPRGAECQPAHVTTTLRLVSLYHIGCIVCSTNKSPRVVAYGEDILTSAQSSIKLYNTFIWSIHGILFMPRRYHWGHEPMTCRYNQQQQHEAPPPLNGQNILYTHVYD